MRPLIASLLLFPALAFAQPTSRPKGMFESDAKKIVYVLDGSGSTQILISHLRLAINEAAAQMKPDQSFDVLFFVGDKVVAFSPTLVAPKDDVKNSLATWLKNFAPKEGSNPIPALRRAFQLQPDEIIFFCDGLDAKVVRPTLVKEVEKMNPKKKVKINTIHVRNGQEDGENAPVLEGVAKQSGGTFTSVSGRDFSTQF